MKKTSIIIFIILIVGGISYFIYNHYKFNGNEGKNNYEAERTSLNQSEKNNSNNNITDGYIKNSDENQELTHHSEEKQPKYKEEQLSTFSTKIYSTDSARQNNINITCNALNGTTIKNGDTFSFCSTVGQSTTAKGYQKADIYDNNGNKKKGLGGGNCQVSSTLYNAVLSVPSLVITERHAHSGYVPYVSKGKDAAVAYGSYDFKFINKTGNDIKITCSTDGKNVITTLIGMKQI